MANIKTELKTGRGYFATIRNDYKIKCLLVSLVLLMVLDGLISNVLVGAGLGREGNSLLQALVGETSFLALKVLGGLLSVFILWDIYKRRPKLALVSSSFFVVLCAGIVLWNLFAFSVTQG